LISLVDRDRQWFKSSIGLRERETPRDASFCAHAINHPEQVMMVPDATLDQRFVQNPLVTGEPGIRFYAGVPLVDSTGCALGTLCIIDNKSRSLTSEEEETLRALGSQVMRLLELRMRNKEVQQISERLRVKNEALHQFALTLSHDIKSPLAGIQMLAELIQGHLPSDAHPKVNDAVEMIKNTGHRLSDLVGDVLDYYKLGSHSEVQPEVFELKPFFDGIMGMILDPNQEAYETHSEVSTIRFKKVVLELVLINLVENAWRHNDVPQLKITIRADQTPLGVRISVSDNGKGMDLEKLQPLQRMFQSSNQTDRFGRKSHGLGLAKVRKLLEQEGIQLCVESAPGAGTSFFFIIPNDLVG
jgi:signal transduction histidine kinase